MGVIDVATGQQRVEIYPSSDNEFYLKVVEASITFHQDGDDPAESLTLAPKTGALSSRFSRTQLLSGARSLRNSRAEVALAVTGIAGPDGGAPDKPVGTVWLGWAVAGGMCRDMGPFITGIILAAMVGSAIAAELGTMKVTEQLDAMEIMAKGTRIKVTLNGKVIVDADVLGGTTDALYRASFLYKDSATKSLDFSLDTNKYVTAEFGYDSFVHNLNHDLMENLQGRAGGKQVYHTDSDPMGRYFLTDAIYAPGNTFYWRIAEGNPSQETIGGGDFFDFHGRFPDDAVIASGQTITVAIGGSEGFFGEYFVEPDYELFEDGTEPDEIGG